VKWLTVALVVEKDQIALTIETINLIFVSVDIFIR
jgi:hypothetical protein